MAWLLNVGGNRVNIPMLTVPVQLANVTVNRLVVPAEDEGVRVKVAFVQDVVAVKLTVVLAYTVPPVERKPTVAVTAADGAVGKR